MKKITILVVEPNKRAYTVKSDNISRTLYDLIYYPYKHIALQKDIYLIYSKEAVETRNSIFKQNLTINNISIYGTFAIVKSENKKLVSLTDNEIKELKDYLNLL